MGGGSGKFLRSFYIVGRGVLTLLFYEDLPPILPNPIPFFSNFVQPLPHCSMVQWPSGPMFKTTVWLKGRLSLLSVRG